MRSWEGFGFGSKKRPIRNPIAQRRNPRPRIRISDFLRKEDEHDGRNPITYCTPDTAYAEGLGVLRSANIGKHTHEIDAETTPLRDPEHYQYDLNLRDVAEVWRRS